MAQSDEAWHQPHREPIDENAIKYRHDVASHAALAISCASSSTACEVFRLINVPIRYWRAAPEPDFSATSQKISGALL